MYLKIKELHDFHFNSYFRSTISYMNLLTIWRLVANNLFNVSTKILRLLLM